MEGINKIIALIVVVLVVLLGLGYMLGRFKAPTQKTQTTESKKTSLGGILGTLFNDDKVTPTPKTPSNSQTITGVVSNERVTPTRIVVSDTKTTSTTNPKTIPDTGATDLLFVLPSLGIGYVLKKRG
ncbi:MAG: hypothetical protein UZ21_OP11001001090 [Microgenomates bacterium OLB22]|nr:MAG: hypothetical protein UZ21_OP11001001090 [Microgenomates bacterium OLB22]